MVFLTNDFRLILQYDLSLIEKYFWDKAPDLPSNGSIFGWREDQAAVMAMSQVP